MKFQVTFQNMSSADLRGLRLLDAVRKHDHNIDPDLIDSPILLNYSQTVDIGESLARRSNQFEDNNHHNVYVNAESKDWRELFIVTGAEMKGNGQIFPVIEFNPQPLLEAWAEQGYTVKKRIQYPFVEQKE